jgi:hypothetical protein
VGPRYDRQRKIDGQRLQQIENDVGCVAEIDEQAARLFRLQRYEKLIRIVDHGRDASLTAGRDLFLDLRGEFGFL